MSLHGIVINNHILFERNLIIYSSSVSLLNQCVLWSQKSPLSITSSHPLRNAIFVAAYEVSGGTGEAEHERAENFFSVAGLAQSFKITSILGVDLTVNKLTNALQISPWIHYHEHTFNDPDDGLNQAFDLGPSAASVYGDGNINNIAEVNNSTATSQTVKSSPHEHRPAKDHKCRILN